MKLLLIQRENLFAHAFVRRDRDGRVLWGYTLAVCGRYLVFRGRRW